MNNLTIDLNTLKPIFDFELFKVRQQDREDVKQDAILEILSSLPKYDSETLPPEKLFSFSQKIVKRVVVDYYRRINRKIDQNSVSVNFCDDVEEDAESGGADAFNLAVEDYNFSISGVRADYHRNIRKFTPTEKRVIEHLLYNEDGRGMTMADISSELGINKSHATRAVQKLRAICNKE
jgi:RNA polymerase sigma factor (sigma-70 family)